MIKPAHIRHLLPLGIALVTGAALAPVIGWSLIAFVCDVPSPSKDGRSTIRNVFLALLDIALAVVSALAELYALWLAVNP